MLGAHSACAVLDESLYGGQLVGDAYALCTSFESRRYRFFVGICANLSFEKG